MKGNRISITEAKARLGELVKRAAYGNEHFILEFRDKPQAAIIGYWELERLERLREMEEDGQRLSDEMEEFRKQLARKTGRVFDTARVLREIREERDERITGLR